ncbi:MAG TPA: hypothetical protein DCF62_08600 [Porticoccaceae bacterium]|nr:hypothetical protein [Porticoccaceae bacterium]HCO61505.1 hypothetical protein [Porticoccaceae bacterium]
MAHQSRFMRWNSTKAFSLAPRLFAFPVLMLVAMGVALGSRASASGLSEDKPFAEAFIILQVSDAASVHHDAALDIANNLMKHYGGQDKVDIQVIAFGAGINLLTKSTDAATIARAERISSLATHGVRFYACGNTLDTIERKTGKRPQTLNNVEVVQTGVAFMVEEIKRGYTLVHP